MESKIAISMFGQKRLTREGGVEIVVKELCTRAVWIYNGEIRMDGNPEKIVDEYLKVCG